MQGKTAVTRSFMRELSSRAPEVVEYLGRAGLAARAVVFAIIGWSLMRGAWFDSSSEVKTLVAAGLLLFGVFSLFAARYRIVPDLERSDLRPTLH